jgi:hypothetical protein
MLKLKYGAAEHFGRINIGFLFGCGPLFETFFEVDPKRWTKKGLVVAIEC